MFRTEMSNEREQECCLRILLFSEKSTIVSKQKNKTKKKERKQKKKIKKFITLSLIIVFMMHRATQWVLKIGREDLLQKDPAGGFPGLKICSMHFEEKVFANSTKTVLKKNAIPTIFRRPLSLRQEIKGIVNCLGSTH